MEAFDYAKSQARRHILEQIGRSTHSSLYGSGDVSPESELIYFDLPVDTRFRTPLRDPMTGLPIFPAGYQPAGAGGAGQ